jgi:ABC-2 type transport system ATP-binding protein
MEITFKKISKNYSKFKALDDVSFNYSGHGAIGYLGPNGAGKTTTLKVMTNLLRPSSGTAELNGIDVNKHTKKAMHNVGSMIETPTPYPFLTVKESLQFVGELRGVDRRIINSKIDEFFDALKLPPLTSKMGQISKGQRQRAVFASVLISDPDIVILDEPTSGLDPFERKIFRNFILELKKTKLVFFSSHILSEVAETCDEVIFINHGKILKQGKIDEISRQFNSNAVSIEFLKPIDDGVRKNLETIGNGLIKVDGRNAVVKFSGGEEERAKILENALKIAPIISYTSYGSDLESAYMSILGEKQSI